MNFLISGFIAILTVTFSLAILATHPAKRDRTIERRMAAIAGHAESSSSREVSQLLKVARKSRFGWLEALLRKSGPWRNLPAYLEQAGVTTTPATLILLSLGLATAGFAAVFLLIPVPPIEFAVAAIAGCLPFLRIAWKRSRRISVFNTSLPGAIDIMARALRAGHSMSAAIGMVAQDAAEPAASEFNEVFKQHNFGLPLREAFLQMLERVPSQDLRVLVTAILVQRETGGNLVEVLDRTVFIIRERLRIYGEIRIQTAQGRLTGWILSLLPIIMLLLINIINPGYSRILLTNPTGRKLIYAGAGLIVLGSFTIHRIVNGIEV